jgi:PBP1b-binding outer membrane lipoprotein LpoB
MKKHVYLYAAALLAAGCASYPAPTEHLASAMAQVRAAQEVGVSQVPQAELHLKLAQDQINQAKALMEEGKNERADYLTLRAYNDASLAMAMTRENAARLRAEQAEAQANQAVRPNQ